MGKPGRILIAGAFIWFFGCAIACVWTGDYALWLPTAVLGSLGLFFAGATVAS